MKEIIIQQFRMISNIVYNFFYSTIFYFIKPKKQKKHYISICAIFKNEGIYFREWIEYHKLIGVDHIYLYNNFSTDNYKEILEDYILDGFVTIKDWLYKRGQISAYEDCFNNYKNETFWLIFLDLDEFICLKYKNDIKKWLHKYDKYPAIIFYWLMFGTNGVIKQNINKLVIEQYTHSWETVRNVGKIILNTNYNVVKMYHHHIFCTMKFCGFSLKVPMINEKKTFIFYPGKEKCPKKNTIQINHYWSKSLDEYIFKIGKGDVYSLKNEEIRKDLEFFYWHEYQNVAENKVIWRYLIALKSKLNFIDVLL